MKFVIVEKSEQVQVKPYHRKGKFVVGYSRLMGERIYSKENIRWSKPVLSINEKMIYMTPDEYIKRIHISEKMTLEELEAYKKRAEIRGLKGILEYPPFSQDKMDHIKTQIAQGKEIEMPWIEYDERGLVSAQEGYHRVLVAKEMGLGQIPIIVVGKELKKSLSDIIKKYGIEKPEKAHLEDKSKRIGYSNKYNKWYGWSHRAISGFKTKEEAVKFADSVR